MDGWGPVIASIGGILTPVGLGFGFLINVIVKTSREAVTELKTERDLWQQRALDAGWRGDR